MEVVVRVESLPRTPRTPESRQDGARDPSLPKLPASLPRPEMQIQNNNDKKGVFHLEGLNSTKPLSKRGNKKERRETETLGKLSACPLKVPGKDAQTELRPQQVGCAGPGARWALLRQLVHHSLLL